MCGVEWLYVHLGSFVERWSSLSWRMLKLEIVTRGSAIGSSVVDRMEFDSILLERAVEWPSLREVGGRIC